MKTDSNNNKFNIFGLRCDGNRSYGRFRRYFIRFCLCSSTLLVSTRLVPTVMAEEVLAAENSTTVKQAESRTTEILKNDTAKEYWQSDINLPTKTSKSSSDLLKAISMLKKVEVKTEGDGPSATEAANAVSAAGASTPSVITKSATTPKAEVIAPVENITADPNAKPVTEAAVADPNGKVVDSTEEPQLWIDPNAPFEEEEIAAEPKNGLISLDIYEKIQVLSEKPETAKNPFMLAEILYKGQCLDEASIFYKEAIKRNEVDKTINEHDRAWILLQIGNCLRKNSRDEAMGYYRKLIKEYPDSEWTYLAKTQEKLLAWHEAFTPQELVKE